MFFLISDRHFSSKTAMVKCDLALYHFSALVFPIIKILAIIIEVFLSYEQSSVHLEHCCAISLMSAACVCQMISHCLVVTTCTPIQLRASIKWK